LDGLNALPSLKELYAAFNHIDNLEPFAGKQHGFPGHRHHVFPQVLA